MRLSTVIPWSGRALVLGYAIAGYFNGMFLIQQVLDKGHGPGVALAIHEGMWSDFFILPPLFKYLIGKLQGDWEATTVKKSLLIGLVITLTTHLLLISMGDKPDPMGWQGGRFSITIVLHFIYMWGAITLAALVLIYSPSATTRMITATCIILGIHTYLGAQIPLGIANRFFHFFPSKRLPEFLIPPAFVSEAVVWVALAGLAWRAKGSRAGYTVLAVGTLLWIIAAAVSHYTKPVW